ncbi:MAG: hypothetical protein WKF91_01750 [Segetibacter sp.]
MKNIRRGIILTLLALSFLTSLYLVVRALQVNQWDTIVAPLAVITAVIAAYISLKIVWRQEDDIEPNIILYFDLDSKSGAIQLLIKNIGGGNAYDVKVIWEEPLLNYANEQVNFPSIPVLLKGETYRSFVGASVETFEKAKSDNSELNFTGFIEYKLTRGKKKHITKEFDLSLEAYRKKLRPISDEQEFYLKNLSIAKELSEIKETLKELASSKKCD